MALPSLAGKRVLDIGAWDGWFSFRAEREGAATVVALDHFVWSLDFTRADEYHAYARSCRERGERPANWGPECAWWDSSRLLGRRPFELAHMALGSAVQPVVLDFADPQAPIDDLGTFDVVFFLGVLYHMEEPLTALRRVRRLTTTLAVIETASVIIDGHEDHAVLEFTPGMEVNEDPTNWYFPNEAAAHGMLSAAGFSEVKTVAKAEFQEIRAGVTHYRLTLHARP